MTDRPRATSDWLDKEKVAEWNQELSALIGRLVGTEHFTPETSYMLHRIVDVLVDREVGVLQTESEWRESVELDYEAAWDAFNAGSSNHQDEKRGVCEAVDAALGLGGEG